MKILMVGLGGIGQRHVRNLRTLMGSEIEILAFRFRNNSPVLTDQLKIEEGSSSAAITSANAVVWRARTRGVDRVSGIRER
ncbi:MAG: hypothetical protein Q8N45_13200 [Anaerolineales bacterium]|nr:hypothetical protein [Anaerolineales bacterium]